MPVSRREGKTERLAASGSQLSGRNKKIQLPWTTNQSYPSLNLLREFVKKVNSAVSTTPVEDGMITAALAQHVSEEYRRDKDWDGENPVQINRMCKNVCDSVSLWAKGEIEARMRKDRQLSVAKDNKYSNIILKNEEGFEWQPSTTNIPEGSHFVAYRPDILSGTVSPDGEEDQEDGDQEEEGQGESGSQP